MFVLQASMGLCGAHPDRARGSGRGSMIGNGGDEVTTDDLTYPMPGFPREEENSTEDWVPVDGKWHNLVYVHHPHGVATDLYVDGKLVPVSGELEPINGFRLWDRAVSRAQVELQYH